MKAQHPQLRLLAGGRDLLIWEGPATGTTLPPRGKVFPYIVEIPNRGP